MYYGQPHIPAERCRAREIAFPVLPSDLAQSAQQFGHLREARPSSTLTEDCGDMAARLDGPAPLRVPSAHTDATIDWNVVAS